MHSSEPFGFQISKGGGGGGGGEGQNIFKGGTNDPSPPPPPPPPKKKKKPCFQTSYLASRYVTACDKFLPGLPLARVLRDLGTSIGTVVARY